MFAILLIYILLLTFVGIIVSSLLYLVYVDFSNQWFNRSVNRIYRSYGTLIAEDLTLLADGEAVDEARIRRVKSKLRKGAYERVFQNILVKFSAMDEFKHLTPLYMCYFQDYIDKRLLKIRVKDSVVFVQNAFMLGEYRLDQPEVIRYLIRGVQSLSIASRFNSMSAIAKIGNAEALVRALGIATESRRYMNMKVMVDILDNFEGDAMLLDAQLVQAFSKGSSELRLLIVNHFHNRRSSEPVKIFLDQLGHTSSKEEKIQLLKYFGVVLFPEATQAMLACMESPHWEVRAIAAKSLSYYVKSIQLQDLQGHLQDENWHVRTNTAFAVLALLELASERPLEAFMSTLSDKYAIGALEYAKHLREQAEANSGAETHRPAKEA